MTSDKEIKELLTAWDQYGPRIRGTLRKRGVKRDDLDDVEQESRIKLVYAVEHGHLPEATRRLAWFVTIAWHVWIDQYTKKRTPQTADETFWAAFAEDAVGADPAEEVADRELNQLLTEAINSLDRGLRRVVELNLEYENLQKVAEKLQRPYSTVRYRQEHARRLLAEMLEAYRDECF